MHVYLVIKSEQHRQKYITKAFLSKMAANLSEGIKAKNIDRISVLKEYLITYGIQENDLSFFQESLSSILKNSSNCAVEIGVILLQIIKFSEKREIPNFRLLIKGMLELHSDLPMCIGLRLLLELRATYSMKSSEYSSVLL